MDLILQKDRCRSGAGILNSSTAHIHGIAVALVAIRDPGKARSDIADGSHGVGHLAGTDQADIGLPDPRR